MEDKQKNQVIKKENLDTRENIEEIKEEYKLGIPYYEKVENKIKKSE